MFRISGLSAMRREVAKMKIALTIVQVIISLGLILVVLFQSGKESGLSGALAGGSETYLSKNKMGGLDKKLAASTKWVALVWVLLTLSLNFV